MISLLQESATYTISNSGSAYIAFFFKGENDFIQRMSNFLYNYGVIKNGEIHKYVESQYYARTPMDNFKRALMDLFRGETILEKSNIDYCVVSDEDGGVTDVNWNDEKVEALTLDKFNSFWSLIEFQNMPVGDTRSFFHHADGYSIGGYQDAEPELLTA